MTLSNGLFWGCLITSPFAIASTIASVCTLSASQPSCPAAKTLLKTPAQEHLTEFAHYRLCHEAEFQLFKIEQHCQLEAYFAEAEAAFQSYQQQVRLYWANANFSDQTQWVRYSNDFQTKTEVDFAHNQIRITRFGQANASAIQALKDDILKTSQLSIEEAQQSDPYLRTLKTATSTPSTSSGSLLPISSDPKQAAKNQIRLLQQINVKETQDINGRSQVIATAPFPISWMKNKARPFLPAIMKYATRFQLEPAFILAIIQTESSFNPTAISHIPAFGLMQVVPTSAGLDSTHYLYGQQQILSQEYLFNPDKNIEVGSAYLYLLGHRYFKGIQNPLSRKYCVIAAYNGGMRPLYKIFGRGQRLASIQAINALTPEQVFQRILHQHPALETQHYLRRVTRYEIEFRQREKTANQPRSFFTPESIGWMHRRNTAVLSNLTLSR